MPLGVPREERLNQQQQASNPRDLSQERTRWSISLPQHVSSTHRLSTGLGIPKEDLCASQVLFS